MKEAAPPARPRRRDALANQDRIVEAAVRLFVERGFAVPVAEIADAAGVGIGTFYRSFPDRAALFEELGMRAYAHIEALIHDIRQEGLVGLIAVRRFLLGGLEIGDRLVLPLQGAPALTSVAAAQARARIDAAVEAFLDQAREAGAVGWDVNATDVILCAALVSRPIRGGPTIERALSRHVELFVSGLRGLCPSPDRPVTQADVEDDFAGDQP
ncbi:TetR/AcrR family transcriptional regulator [Micromonospora sp. 067-2]|uniref:TetR/AcrR family transcriptional regulator n=1 Tax=Micromonospora sp. 067-2 TaxID=2789270 RepID=UPI00397C5126